MNLRKILLVCGIAAGTVLTAGPAYATGNHSKKVETTWCTTDGRLVHAEFTKEGDNGSLVPGHTWIDEVGTCSPPKDGATGQPGPAGPKGDKGDAGATGGVGPQGPAGPAGPAGPSGSAGAPGVDGRDGAPGLNGVNCYDFLAVTEDHTPSVDDCLGAPGEPGVDGQDGADGSDGVHTIEVINTTADDLITELNNRLFILEHTDPAAPDAPAAPEAPAAPPLTGELPKTGAGTTLAWTAALLVALGALMFGLRRAVANR